MGITTKSFGKDEPEKPANPQTDAPDNTVPEPAEQPEKVLADPNTGTWPEPDPNPANPQSPDDLVE
jgi:hypothetical protein